MIRRFCLAAGVLLAGVALAQADPPPQPPEVRLLLAISVDQMRGDYLERFAFTRGFARLKAEGAVFADAHHAHIPTETGPGHAVILTGKLPDRHGIVANNWYDRLAGREVYSLADSVHGLGPENLLAYTLGDALKARDARARVAAVSLKDRAAILMGGKRADFVAWHDSTRGRAVSSSYYGEEPAWLAGLTAPDAMRGTPAGDEFVLKLASEALARLKLGRDAVTDLLVVSFSSPDHVGHRHGIDGPQLAAQYAALDGVIGRLLELAEKRAGKGRVLAVLTSDHGVVPAPEDPSGQAMNVRRVSAAAAGQQLEAKLQALAPAPGRRWILAVSSPHVYLDRALADALDLDWPRFLEKAARAVASLDGVAEVYTSGNYRQSDLVRRSFHPGRAGDLIVLARPAVIFTDSTSGTTHGTHHRYDTHVPMIFWGAGVKPGRHADPAWVADIAPTLARILGIEWAPIDGSRVRVEALR